MPWAHPVGMSVTQAAQRSGAAVLVASCLLAAQCLPQPADAQELSIGIVRDGDVITVRASAGLKANPRIAWEVLTDYDHLAEFIPDIHSSRVLRRDGDGVVVEQKGEFGFLLFRLPIEVTMVVSEQPPRRVVAHAIAGNMKDMEGRYELLPSETGLKLNYYGRFSPDFTLPPLIGMPIMRRSLERRFRAMVEEIERRDVLAKRGDGKSSQ